MDILDLSFETGSFASVIDKGTFDALCCDRKPETIQKLETYLDQCLRVLATSG